jgi:hypothetical protein
MTWYFQYQRAEDIVAEYERRARIMRLERLADEAAAEERQPTRSPIRRSIGWAVLTVGRATTRFGGAVTRVGHAVRGAGATPAT